MNANDKYQNFVAGMVAGFVSVTICNPLDVTRTRLNIMVKFTSSIRTLRVIITPSTLGSGIQCRLFTKSKDLKDFTKV